MASFGENAPADALERYDLETKSFVPVTDLQVVTWTDLLDPDQEKPAEGTRVFQAATIFDIPRTTIAALRQVSKRYPGSYVCVQNYPSALEEIVSNRGDTVPVLDVTIVPSEVKDQDTWREVMMRLAFSAGFSGALVTPKCVELAEEFPEKELFKFDPKLPTS